MKKFFVVLTGITLTLISYVATHAQCTDIFTAKEETDGFRSEITETEAEKNAKKTNGEKIYTHILAKIESDEQFKISLDTDLSSAFSKSEDIVAFTVLENVYGKGFIKDGEKNQEKRCVVIPKGAKIYGVVDYAHSRYPFNIGGKAKLFVTVNDFKLENGQSIQIRFVEPSPPLVESKDGKEKVKIWFKDCKFYPNRKCIVGRRNKITFPTQVIAAGTSASLLLLKDDDTTTTIAGLSFIDSLSKISGVDSIVNPPDAQLKKEMIFEVKTKDITKDTPIKAWVSLSQAAPKKPDDDKK